MILTKHNLIAFFTVTGALLTLLWWSGFGQAAPAVPPAPKVETPLIQVESLFEFLFSPRRRTREPRSRNRDQRRRDSNRPRRRATPASGNSAPPPSVEKAPDAKQVMVIGDVFASGLAKALAARFSNTPSVVILNRAKPGSGIVRNDFYDWNAELVNFLGSEKIDALVIVIGSNDRQAIKDEEGVSHSFRTQSWLTIYERRVQKMLTLADARSIPIFWVGLPVMRSSEYGLEIAFLNELFAQQSRRVNAVFVDVWERFADGEGKYNASGPDENGRTRQLRMDNGIHLTKEGNKKLAYFVDLELRPRLTGLVTSYPLDSSNPFATQDPRTRSLGVEISLTNPPINPRDLILAGAHNEVVSGQVAATSSDTQQTPQKGRADDFSWPQPDRVESEVTPPPS